MTHGTVVFGSILEPMRHRCATCQTVDGHEPGCPENNPPEDLPDGLVREDGVIKFRCRSCGQWAELPVEPEEFDPNSNSNVCGGSPRCCP